MKPPKKIFFLIFLLIPIILSGMIEFLIMNGPALIHPNYSKVVKPMIISGAKKEGAYYHVTDDVAQLQYSFPERYVDAFSFAITNPDKLENVSYSVNVNGEEKVMANTMVNGVPNRLFGLPKKTIRIDEKTNNIQFNLFGFKDHRFKLAKAKISNYITFNFVRFAILVVFTSLLLFLILVLLKRISPQKWVVYAAFSIGTLFAFLTPVHYTWDEYAHFIKAYSVSQGVFLLKDNEPLNYPKGMDTVNFDQGLEYQSYGDFKTALRKYNQISIVDTEKTGKPTTALLNTFVPYIFSGLGMKVAELFSLPAIFLIWFGRWFNVVAYTVLLWCIMRWSKVGETSFAYFLLLPVNLFIAASLSTDLFALSGISLGTGLILNQKKSTAESQRWRVVATICFALSVLVKVTYAPIFLLFFLTVPFEKYFYKSKEWIYSCISFFVGVLTSIVTFVYSQLYGGIAQWDLLGIDPVSQIKWIYHNPMNFFEVLKNFFKDSSINLIKNMFSALGFVGPEALSQFMTIILLSVLIWLVIADFSQTNENELLILHSKDQVIVGIQLVASVLLSVIALYVTFTPVGSSTINGFQGRYLLPILPTIFILGHMKTFKVETSLWLRKKVMIWTIFFLNLSVFIEILTQYYIS